MKISFIEPHLKLSGGIRGIIELANRSVERGHEVTIFHSDGSSCKWMECRAKVKSYDNVLSETHDVIIYNDVNNSIDYKLVKKAKARLKVFYIHELYEKELLQKINLSMLMSDNKRMLVLKKSLCSSYLKLANTTWEKEWLKEKMNIDSQLLIGGVNTDLFHPANRGKKSNKIHILCSGDNGKMSGTETILEAVEIARKEGANIELDTYHGEGITPEKMAEKYSSADIFIDAQWEAGWNNTVAEAMACKVPVVCTDTGEVKDFAFHEKTALLVLPGDTEAMASALLRLIREDKLRETLKENAYSHIKQFNWDKCVVRLEEILSSELKRKRNLMMQIQYAILNPTKAVNKVKKILNNFFNGNSFDKYKEFGAYHWEAYKKDPIYKKHVDYVVKDFQMRSNGTLLDIGCGDGFLSHLLTESGFSVKGVDRETEAIKLAKEKCQSASFEVKDIFDVDEQFDYLLTSEVIEHLPDADAFLHKIKELFTKEALITTPKKDYYKQMDPYHVKEYNVFEFEALLIKYFSDVEIHESEHHLYAWIKKK